MNKAFYMANFAYLLFLKECLFHVFLTLLKMNNGFPEKDSAN